MPAPSRNRTALLAGLPPEWPGDLRAQLREHALRSERTVVVLDDDPTGTQTVHDVPVLTGWSVEALQREFEAKAPLFFILTNSRSVFPDRACLIAREAGRNLMDASRLTGRAFTVISRSDSTLRGHYPAEVDALAETLGMEEAIHVLIPFFLEGGRLTYRNIHWVAGGDELVPVAETPFARDPSFGYTSSNLCDWVEEKTHGRVPAHTVATLAVEDLRSGGPAYVEQNVMALPPRSVCVVNALTEQDLDVAALGLLFAETKGRPLIYRTGASFVSARVGMPPRPLLSTKALNLEGEGAGLVVVGSHVPLSTRQLNHALEHAAVTAVELDAGAVLDGGQREREIAGVAEQVQQALETARDTVLYISRELITGASAEENLRIARSVSAGLVDVIRRISCRPRYLLAKGGITSSDVATRGLGLERAIVLGQILPGVPVYRLKDGSRFPDLTYVVFPGNVGEVDAITRVVRTLSDRPGSPRRDP